MSEQVAIKLAKKPDVKKVFINQDINKMSELTRQTNYRPDVAWITDDEKIHVLEIMSNSDRYKILKIRTKQILDRIPEQRRGSTNVKEKIQIMGEK